MTDTPNSTTNMVTTPPQSDISPSSNPPRKLSYDEYRQLAEANPDRFKICSNGTIYDRSIRRFVATNNDLNPYVITPERSRQLKALRQQQARDAILRGIADGTKAMTWRGGVERMASAMAQLVLDGGNRAPEAMRVLLQGAGLLETGRRQGGSDDVPVQGARLEVSAAALDKLLMILRQARGLYGDDDDSAGE